MTGNQLRDLQHLDELAQLPHGRHGLPPEFVQRNQRERLVHAFTALVGEVGYGAATITGTTEGAGVSSNTFYKYFATIEECCIAAVKRELEGLRPIVSAAYRSESDWPLSIRAAIAAILDDFAQYPDVARLLTVEPFVAGPKIATLHKTVIEEMVPYLRHGRELSQSPDSLPRTAERGLLGAANSLVARQVLAGKAPSLPGLLPDLAQFVLTPYVGAAAARRVAKA